MSSRIACAWARASSRILAASSRAPASCWVYLSSAARASFCASSALAMPPSMALVRAAYAVSNCGQTNFASTQTSTPNAIAAMTTSPQGRPMGLVASPVAAVLIAAVLIPAGLNMTSLDSPVAGEGSGQDEGDHEAQQRQRLGHREPQEGVGPGQAGRFRLAGGRLNVGGPHDAHTDTGSDRGEAVPEGADVAGDFGELRCRCK